jgi:hypothetical protein
MKWDKQETNWIIDIALFGGFLLALWLDLTGVAAHQWLGLAGGRWQAIICGCTDGG